MFSPTPHDVLAEYTKHYGQDCLFPTVSTPLGRLACVASEEILYPEVTRALAISGAEVICHSSSESGSPIETQKSIAKLARAYENHVYVVSANTAGFKGVKFPCQSTDGNSTVVNYLGKTLALAGQGESMVAHAHIDIESLRTYRQTPGMFNLLSRQRFELFTDIYKKTIYPANGYVSGNGAIESIPKELAIQTQRETIKRLKEQGTIV